MNAVQLQLLHHLIAGFQRHAVHQPCQRAETDGFHSGEAEYEAFIADYAKTWRVCAENAREANPFESFIFNESPLPAPGYRWY